MRRLSAGGWLLAEGEAHPASAQAWRVVRERWKEGVPRAETATIHVWRDEAGFYGRESGPICPQGRSAVQAVLRVAGAGVTEVVPPGERTRVELQAALDALFAGPERA